MLRFRGEAQEHLLWVDIALHTLGFIDAEGARFDSGSLGKELQQYVKDKPGHEE